ncbi:hypothetical protein ACRAWF_20605 [Streptomyces sp. L7]
MICHRAADHPSRWELCLRVPAPPTTRSPGRFSLRLRTHLVEGD